MNTPQTNSLDTVKVSIGKEKFKTIVEAEGHTLIADEPLSENGTGQGMNPYTLLLASLGTCTAMTLRGYADRKGWALEDVEVELSLDKTEQNGLPVTEIKKQIRLKGVLSEMEKQRLHTVAACPVHKTLTHKINIHTLPLA